MKIINSLCLALAIAFMGSVAVAQESEGQCQSKCQGSSSTVAEKSCSQCPSSTAVAVQTEEKSCSQCPSSTAVAAAKTDEKTCSECPVAVAMKNLPAMTYKVGETATCCSESATKLAKENDKPVHYVVGAKTFEKKQEAYTALVESTEKFVNEFVTPSKCEKSGKTSIAGTSCGCPMEAGKRTELVKKAIGEVKMTYVVGEKECNCPTQAKALAETADAKTTYKVAGKSTCCNMEARLNLAKAKYAAAVKALASTEKKEEKAAAASS